MNVLLRTNFVYICLSLFIINSEIQAQSDAYALDDAHNHDGTHLEGQNDCGSNYILPNEKARLGSHSFLILGATDENHVILEHRSGTPPHNYQFILQVRLDPDEMAFYQRLTKVSKTPPAVTTIYFDDNDPKKQLDRTFFCLNDLPKIFGSERKPNDGFDKLFPIRASLQKDADFEGSFDILKSIYPGGHWSLNRDDITIIVYRYLPTYLDQTLLKKALKQNPKETLPRLNDHPLFANEEPTSAKGHTVYGSTDALIPLQTLEQPQSENCPDNYYLKGVFPHATIHSFLLLAEIDAQTVLASHLYDSAPQNYQTILKLKLSKEELQQFRTLSATSKGPLLLQTLAESPFCMARLKDLVQNPQFSIQGDLYANNKFDEFQKGQKVGHFKIKGSEITVITNRNLQSLMNAHQVALQAFDFVDVKKEIPSIQVEMRYNSKWNFTGSSIDGYRSNKCWLTKQAVKALSKVQMELQKMGFSLLIFDCLRPQRAVDHFAKWAKDINDQTLKSVFYPDIPKEKLFIMDYIAEKSGHSRGSTVDLTIVKVSSLSALGSSDDKSNFKYRERHQDCRKNNAENNSLQLNMGTTFDCFDPLASTLHPGVSAEAKKNRLLLKSTMEKSGFVNYPKEWWHYTLKNEPYTDLYFDIPIE